MDSNINKYILFMIFIRYTMYLSVSCVFICKFTSILMILSVKITPEFMKFLFEIKQKLTK